MDRSTKAVSLVLIGSALALAGCARHADDDENRQGARGGVGYVPRVGMGGIGGGSRTGGAIATPSARGGFGATGSLGSAS